MKEQEQSNTQKTKVVSLYTQSPKKIFDFAHPPKNVKIKHSENKKILQNENYQSARDDPKDIFQALKQAKNSLLGFKKKDDPKIP